MENKIFVKINYKLKGIDPEVRCDARINYINCNDSDKYMIGGGFCSKNACSFAFRAKDLEEAKFIANNNPMIKNWVNKDNIKWDFIFIPEI